MVSNVPVGVGGGRGEEGKATTSSELTFNIKLGRVILSVLIYFVADRHLG